MCGRSMRCWSTRCRRIRWNRQLCPRTRRASAWKCLARSTKRPNTLRMRAANLNKERPGESRAFLFITPATMGLMSPAKQATTNPAVERAARLTEARHRERMVPRFVDSYVVEHGRHGLQVHAALYRDLLALLQREALIAISVRAMEIVTSDFQPTARSKPRPMAKKDAAPYRCNYLAPLPPPPKHSIGD